MKLIPYWLDTAEPSGDYRRTPVPDEVDVVIIGAGFTGLSAALEFAKHGASVAVVDRHTVGWGASGRSGGMATTGLAISFNTAVKPYGGTRAMEMFRAYNDAIDTIENWCRTMASTVISAVREALVGFSGRCGAREHPTSAAEFLPGF